MQRDEAHSCVSIAVQRRQWLVCARQAALLPSLRQCEVRRLRCAASAAGQCRPHFLGSSSCKIARCQAASQLAFHHCAAAESACAVQTASPPSMQQESPTLRGVMVHSMRYTTAQLLRLPVPCRQHCRLHRGGGDGAGRGGHLSGQQPGCQAHQCDASGPRRLWHLRPPPGGPVAGG